jgi:hypothetical protein
MSAGISIILAIKAPIAAPNEIATNTLNKESIKNSNILSPSKF